MKNLSTTGNLAILRYVANNNKRNRSKLLRTSLYNRLCASSTEALHNTKGWTSRASLASSSSRLPSFYKEWKNTIYSYNKNELKNIPVNNLNVNKVIKSYFDLYFKDIDFLGKTKSRQFNVFKTLKTRRNSLTRIFVSDAETKHTNSKAIITLYVVNREKKNLLNKYLKINEIVGKELLNLYFSLLSSSEAKSNKMVQMYKLTGENSNERSKYILHQETIVPNTTTKKNYILNKLALSANLLPLVGEAHGRLQSIASSKSSKDISSSSNSSNVGAFGYRNTKFIELNSLYSKKIWSAILNEYSVSHLKILREYYLMYSLNQFKFNKLILLPKLSNLLTKILGKKIEYNIINLKSIAYHTDLFTNAIALKLKSMKARYYDDVLSILNRAYLPKVNTIKERAYLRTQANNLIPSFDCFVNKTGAIECSDLKMTNSGSEGKNLNTEGLYTNIHRTIFDSILYKNLGGIKIELNGRLTKRYRADRSLNYINFKGGLKNIDSSFKGLSAVSFRGNTNANTSYSLATGKRRIGAFAVKGWISGK